MPALPCPEASEPKSQPLSDQGKDGASLFHYGFIYSHQDTVVEDIHGPLASKNPMIQLIFYAVFTIGSGLLTLSWNLFGSCSSDSVPMNTKAKTRIWHIYAVNAAFTTTLVRLRKSILYQVDDGCSAYNFLLDKVLGVLAFIVNFLGEALLGFNYASVHRMNSRVYW
jgi:hypothetical protein